ncbi:tRNA nucleotidyltransferase (CCA-adding enzyme) [Alkalibacillus flavidus]|uniref:CCA-adding enzyme n=1 Tax=Alkalibacillus flavidus TaxID=546021 RepID=A0ABV2KRW1_9BACI
MLSQPFQEAIPVIDQFEQHGYEAYFVGGAVRDHLLGQSIGDVDIATNATPDVTMSLFDRTVPVGIDHGTVLVLHNGNEYEVTTYRVESDYRDYRRPDHVAFVSRLEDDLARRDLTINAMAMDRYGQVIDPFQGRNDLTHGVIRTVGRADDRFHEDALRMLRAVRFSSQLNFAVTNDVLTAIKRYHTLLQEIAVERIQVEWFKLFTGYGVAHALDVLNKTDMYQSLPLLNQERDVIKHLTKNIKRPIRHPEAVMALCACLSNTLTLNDWIKSYRCSNIIQRQAKKLIQSVSKFKENGLTSFVVYTLGDVNLEAFQQVVQSLDLPDVSLEQLHEVYEALPIQSKQQIAVDGKQLQSIIPDWRKGPWIGRYLQAIERAILAGQLSNDYEAIERRVKQWKEQEND